MAPEFSLHRLIAILSILLCLAVSCEVDAEDELAKVDFARDVQPILVENCLGCHGPDLQESNYRLDVRERALGAGDIGTPIVPGSSKDSPLVHYISQSGELTKADFVMPPEDEGERLSTAQVSLIRRWIDAGAEWPDALAGDSEAKLTTDHWSFQAVQNPTPPTADSDWGENEIDRFVVARLKQAGLRPSPRADRVTLIRRLYLDMHGLPPTPQQVSDFAADDRGEAYESLVTQILDSPNYGERWARHWLDVARFGESTGYEVNRDRENAYHFRDYVIDAFNSDKPYSNFIVEQLAGDVVGSDVGTGFLVGGPYDLVKSPDINLTLMQRQDELADYVNTVSTAFLAMTVGCARCHNHKFDPILQKDFYAMQAVFAGVKHGERELRDALTVETEQQWKNAEQKRKQLELQVERFRASAKDEVPNDADARPAVDFARNVEEFMPVRTNRVRFNIRATAGGSEPCIDELEIFSTDDQNVALASNGATASASGTLPGYAIHKLAHINDGKFGNSQSWISNTPGGGWVQIDFAELQTIDRIVWARDRDGVVRDRLATSYTIQVSAESIGWQTVASSDDRRAFKNAKPAEDAFIARLPEATATQAREAYEKLVEVRETISRIRKEIPKAYIGTFTKPEEIRRLYRGDPLTPREVVKPGALTVISELDVTNETPESARRLALAKWIASEQNPLTARVIVNRVWHYHFGTGLVSTPSDFGRNGTAPSHPQLLDWLAWNFMQQGWSLKWLHREIMMSSTYRQSSLPQTEALAKDNDCRLLWRFPPRRLEAEAIRDCVLKASGALNPKAGGPGFLLFEINHENVHHYYPKKEFGPEEFRRMIYMTKIRQEQDAVFGVFDCPDGGQVIPDRSRSTTPLQALNLLNSQFMLQQADLFARRVKMEAGDKIADQIETVFRLAYSRAPDETELKWAEGFVEENGLEALCRAVLNSNEFLFLS